MLRHPATLRVRDVLVALTLALALSACGDDDTEADTTEAPAGSTSTTATTAKAPDYGTGGGDASGAPGTIVAADFTLSDLTVEPGAEVVLDNQDSVAHTATADDGAFDLGEVAAGETSGPATAPDEPGDYGFHCEIHPDMTATLTVEG
jgi:plastocyanin